MDHLANTDQFSRQTEMGNSLPPFRPRFEATGRGWTVTDDTGTEARGVKHESICQRWQAWEGPLKSVSPLALSPSGYSSRLNQSYLTLSINFGVFPGPLSLG